MNDGIVKIGVVGTGYVAKGLVLALEQQSDLVVTKVLTRRNRAKCSEFPRQDLLTNSVNELIDNVDLLVECSGDVLHATEVIDQALMASLPVVTMNSEFHVTTGSYFVERGVLTEAEGDQPGCLAALRENAIQMGFKPLVYGNVKGFLNYNPTPDEMRYWSEKQGISLGMVTAATDGTKIQVEQALVANGLNANIAAPGLLGVSAEALHDGANILADAAKRLAFPISDYIHLPNSPTRVFIVAEHDEAQREYLRYLKLGDGPYYVLPQNYILVHLEIAKTIRRVLNGQGVLLNNTAYPTISVAALAKKALVPGDKITRGVGSFEVRGVAIKIADNPGHVPIGLLTDAVITKPVESGRLITFEDVEIPDSLALKAWQHVESKAKLAHTDHSSLMTNTSA